MIKIGTDHRGKPQPFHGSPRTGLMVTTAVVVIAVCARLVRTAIMVCVSKPHTHIDFLEYSRQVITIIPTLFSTAQAIGG